MPHRYKIISLFILTILAIGTHAKPRFVDLNNELKNARFTGRVIIDRYGTSGNIFFHSIEFRDTVTTAFANYKTGHDKIYRRKDGRQFLGPDIDLWTGYWPSVKDTVLIVIDTFNKVSVFAKLINTNYRFWSPYFTRSTAMFYYSSPATKLPGTPELVNTEDVTNFDKFSSCWDGCLLAFDQLYTISSMLFPYTGTAMMVDGKAVFAYDLADSALYYLEGLEKWDEKYLNKRIKVFGQLVTINGVTFFKKWKIVEL